MKAEYFESVEVSDLGRQRKNNEDACLRIPDRGIYCVADGMGGQAGGDLASEAITTTLQEVFAKAGPEEDSTLSRRIALFRKAANQASKWIKNFADEKVIGQMGSTLVALVIDPRNPARAVGLHAGDSRLYRYRKGELKLLTSDHSAVAAIAAKLGRDPASIPAKYQNELLRCVGLNESVELEKTPVDVVSGDLFLICSDGLTRMLPDKTIAKILKRGVQDSISTVAQTLINGANEAGGRDNITVVLVKVGDISGVPNVIDPEDAEETETLAAPASPSVAEPRTPPNIPSDSSGIPDTADAYQGDTPRTDDLTPDKTPSSAQPRKGLSDISGEKKVAKKNKEKNKKILALGIAISVAVVAVVGAGIWFIANSKPKTKPPTFLATATTTNQPSAVAPTTTISLSQSSVTNKTDVQPQIKTQEAYREAMKKGQSALDNQDYTNAVAWAVMALQKKPDDLAATKLQEKAQKLMGDYNQAIDHAQQAYQRGDYPEAITQADKVLAIRKDDFMQRLKADAQSQIKIQEACREAMRNAQSAFDNHDYTKAAAWAAEVLQKMPGDSAATKLQEDARRLAAVEDLNRKYQVALQDGQEAMKNNNYALAAAKAKEALALRPNDPAATQLAGQTREPVDLESARNFFDQGDYEAVVKLCKAYPGIDAFKNLATSNSVEQAALSDARDLFNNGDYSFTVRLKRQPYGRKPPFAKLFNQATNEWEILGDLVALERATNWQAVLGKLADPAFAELTNKPPFRALAQRAKPLAVQAANQKELAQLNVTFETMLVWFNIKSPTDSYVQTPEARRAKRIDGRIDETQRDKYLKMLDQLESGYKQGGWLNQNSHAKYIEKLRDAITQHK